MPRRPRHQSTEPDPAMRDVASSPAIPIHWSRPCGLHTFLVTFGWAVPCSIDRKGFEALAEKLAVAGVDVRLVSDPFLIDETDAKQVRVQVRRSVTGDDLGGKPSMKEPTIVVRAAGSGPPHTESTTVIAEPALEPHALARLRLELLTAIPSTRRRPPLWPDAFLQAATAGLTLDSAERKLLRCYAASFAFGTHAPDSAIRLLAKSVRSEEWTALLPAFVRLNEPVASAADIDEVLDVVGVHAGTSCVIAVKEERATKARAADVAPSEARNTRGLGFNVFDDDDT